MTGPTGGANTATDAGFFDGEPRDNRRSVPSPPPEPRGEPAPADDARGAVPGAFGQDPTTLAALAGLRAPFPPESVGVLPKPTSRENPPGRCDVAGCSGWHGIPAVHLPYVGHAAVTDRLLDADPCWSWEPVAFTPDGLPMLDPGGGLWITLTVRGVTRYGYGDAGGSRGSDAVKVAIGDALRNAAMRFGVALDLWTRDELPSQAAVAVPVEPFDADGYADGVRALVAATSDLADLRAVYADVGEHADRIPPALVLDLRAAVTDRAEVVRETDRQDAATEPEPAPDRDTDTDAGAAADPEPSAAEWPPARQPPGTDVTP